MIAVIFEVVPEEGKRQAYMDIAADLRPSLEEIDGLLSIERFESPTKPGKILSLSFFRDKNAVAAWRVGGSAANPVTRQRGVAGAAGGWGTDGGDGAGDGASAAGGGSTACVFLQSRSQTS
jgi:heme-degrading monooxygenase HmoA